MAYLGGRSRRTVQQHRNPQRNLKATQHPVQAWYQSIDWSRVRFSIVGIIFLLLWGVLWGRAAYLQLFDGGFLADRARRQHTSVEMVTGQRGMIFDRNGQVLARSVESRSVYINPREVADAPYTANKLSEILGLPAAQLATMINPRRAFVWVARKVDDAAAEAIRRADLPGVGLVKEFERLYPFKQVAGQLLGFTNVDSNGLEGLERAFDNELSGMSTRRTVRRDASGRRFYVSGGEVPAGQDLNLTIDVQVQFLTEEALAEAVQTYDARWGGALMVDVESGEILAWAQYPFFNPNAYGEYNASLYRNRIALDALEPGSTLKPLMVAAALQEGVITRDTVFDCENGQWTTRKITIRDDRRIYGKMPVNKILSLSSNIGCAKISLTLGAAKYHNYLAQLGFGQRTGLHVAESKGILHRVRDWSEADTMSIGFGQGMATTLLQLTQAYLTLGNEGVYKPLRLVREDAAVQGAEQRVFSEKVSREVLTMMREVVDDGTGRRAGIAGVSVAGKTGTAQKADKSGTYGNQRTASFVGFVPADKPRYLVVIMLDEPQKNQYGGVIAAPVFKSILTRTLAYHGTPPEALAELAPEPGSKAGKNSKTQTKGGKQQKSGKVPVLPVASGVAMLAPELEAEDAVGVPGGEYRHDMSDRVRDANNKDVPDVVGKSVRRAVELFVMQGVVPVVRGEGSTVVRQSPEAGTQWPEDKQEQECILWISEK